MGPITFGEGLLAMAIPPVSMLETAMSPKNSDFFKLLFYFNTVKTKLKKIMGIKAIVFE